MAYISSKLIKSAEKYLASLYQKKTLQEIYNAQFNFINKSIKTDQTLIEFYPQYFAHTYGDVKLENLKLQLNPMKSFDNYDSIRAYSDYYHKIDPWNQHFRNEVIKRPTAYVTRFYPYTKAKKYSEWYNDFLTRFNAHQTIIACYQVSPSLVIRNSFSRKDTSPSFEKGEYDILSLVGNNTMNATRNLIRLMNVQNYCIEKDDQIQKTNEHISLFHSVFNYLKEYLFLFDENCNSVFFTSEAIRLIDELKTYPIQMSTINNLLFPSQLVFKLNSFVRKQIERKETCTLSDYLNDEITFLQLYSFKITFAKIFPENNSNNKMYFTLRLIPKNYNSKLLLLKHKYILTQREYEVIEQLLSGKTINETSYILHISQNTVKSHLKNIFFKLNISSVKEIFVMLI